MRYYSPQAVRHRALSLPTAQKENPPEGGFSRQKVWAGLLGSRRLFRLFHRRRHHSALLLNSRQLRLDPGIGRGHHHHVAGAGLAGAQPRARFGRRPNGLAELTQLCLGLLVSESHTRLTGRLSFIACGMKSRDSLGVVPLYPVVYGHPVIEFDSFHTHRTDFVHVHGNMLAHVTLCHFCLHRLHRRVGRSALRNVAGHGGRHRRDDKEGRQCDFPHHMMYSFDV